MKNLKILHVLIVAICFFSVGNVSARSQTQNEGITVPSGMESSTAPTLLEQMISEDVDGVSSRFYMTQYDCGGCVCTDIDRDGDGVYDNWNVTCTGFSIAGEY